MHVKARHNNEVRKKVFNGSGFKQKYKNKRQGIEVHRLGGFEETCTDNRRRERRGDIRRTGSQSDG